MTYVKHGRMFGRVSQTMHGKYRVSWNDGSSSVVSKRAVTTLEGEALSRAQHWFLDPANPPLWMKREAA